jgi:hypothetical protein
LSSALAPGAPAAAATHARGGPGEPRTTPQLEGLTSPPAWDIPGMGTHSIDGQPRLITPVELQTVIHAELKQLGGELTLVDDGLSRNVVCQRRARSWPAQAS